ncbi:MAG: general stress protein CsbD [Bacteroidales bacterium]|nr:general stress protein CsbD [Bacteroidales bacterium]
MEHLIGLHGNWNETKGKLKLQFAMLSNEDLLLLEGRQEELITRLQTKLGMSSDEIRTIISDL